MGEKEVSRDLLGSWWQAHLDTLPSTYQVVAPLQSQRHRDK